MGGSNKKREVFVIGFRNQRILLGKNGLELTSYYFMWKLYIVFFCILFIFEINYIGVGVERLRGNLLHKRECQSKGGPISTTVKPS